MKGLISEIDFALDHPLVGPLVRVRDGLPVDDLTMESLVAARLVIGSALTGAGVRYLSGIMMNESAPGSVKSLRPFDVTIRFSWDGDKEDLEAALSSVTGKKIERSVNPVGSLVVKGWKLRGPNLLVEARMTPASAEVIGKTWAKLDGKWPGINHTAWPVYWLVVSVGGLVDRLEKFGVTVDVVSYSGQGWHQKA